MIEDSSIPGLLTPAAGSNEPIIFIIIHYINIQYIMYLKKYNVIYFLAQLLIIFIRFSFS